MFDAGSIVGFLKLDMSDFAHGVQESTLISQIFPAAMVEFFEHPLLAIAEVAKEAARFVVESIEQIAGSFHNVGLSAERAGVSVEWLSKMSAVAKTAGVSIDQFVFGLKTLEKQAELASEGEQGATKAFQRLGISAKEAAALMATPQALFERVKQSIDSIQDPSQRTAAALAILGRQGFNLVPFLTKSSAEIEAFGNTLEGLGGTVNQEEAELGATFGKLETIFSAAWTGIKKAIAEPILQALGGDADELTGKIKELSTWIRDGISGAFQTLAPLVKSVWSVFSGLGDAIGSVVMPVFTALLPVLKLVAEALTAIFNVIGEVLSAIGGTVRGVTDFFGITDASSRAKGAAGAAAGGKNEYHFHVEGVDENTTTTQLAQKMVPHMQKAHKEQKQKLEHAVSHQKVAAALRGEH